MLGKIAILASEQRWLDEANGAEVVSEGTDGSGMKDDKPKEGGGRPRVLTDGTYAIETAYVTTRARLEAVKAATKPPLRSMFPPCFGVILWLLMFVSLRQRLFQKVTFFYGCYPCHSAG